MTKHTSDESGANASLFMQLEGIFQEFRTEGMKWTVEVNPATAQIILIIGEDSYAFPPRITYLHLVERDHLITVQSARAVGEMIDPRAFDGPSIEQDGQKATVLFIRKMTPEDITERNDGGGDGSFASC